MDWIQLALLGARVIVGGVLILAGFSKLALGPATFLRVVRAYELLPDRLSRVVATALPPIEVAVGTIIVVGAFAPVAGLFGLLVLGVVTTAAGSVLARGLKTPCGCFGEFDTAVSRTVIARNGVLMALLVPGVLIGGGDISFDAVPSVRWYVAAAVVAASALLAALRARGAAAQLVAGGVSALKPAR